MSIVDLLGMRMMKVVLEIVMALTLVLCIPALSYAQVCKQESILSSTPTSQFVDNGNGTITDTKTELMWKRCGEGQVWSHGQCQGDAITYTWKDALDTVKASNASGGYSGHVDWRLPNIKELSSIVEQQCYDPAFNLSIFPNIPSSSVYAYFWSSSITVDNSSLARKVNSYYGYDSWSNKEDLFYIRLVRNATSDGSRYLVKGELVADLQEKLMWQDTSVNAATMRRYDDANSYCNSLVHGGFSDWRLPSISELKTIVDISRNPAIVYPFQHYAAQSYWSSSTGLNSNCSGASCWSYMKGVNFSQGSEQEILLTYIYYFGYAQTTYGEALSRCVRTGESF